MGGSVGELEYFEGSKSETHVRDFDGILGEWGLTEGIKVDNSQKWGRWGLVLRFVGFFGGGVLSLEGLKH